MENYGKEEEATRRTTNVKFMRSRDGILMISEMVLSLLAFICEESVPECTGYARCSPPAYMHTYRFFAFVTFMALLTQGAIFAVKVLGTGGRIVIPTKYQPFAQFAYLCTMCFFYFFADAFLIARTGNRLGYQIGAVFGVLAIMIYAVQLALFLAESNILELLRAEKKNIFPGAESAPKSDSNRISQTSWDIPNDHSENDAEFRVMRKKDTSLESVHIPNGEPLSDRRSSISSDSSEGSNFEVVDLNPPENGEVQVVNGTFQWKDKDPTVAI